MELKYPGDLGESRHERQVGLAMAMMDPEVASIEGWHTPIFILPEGYRT